MMRLVREARKGRSNATCGHCTHTGQDEASNVFYLNENIFIYLYISIYYVLIPTRFSH